MLGVGGLELGVGGLALGLQGFLYTNMLVSANRKSHVRGIAQRETPTRGFHVAVEYGPWCSHRNQLSICNHGLSKVKLPLVLS